MSELLEIIENILEIPVWNSKDYCGTEIHSVDNKATAKVILAAVVEWLEGMPPALNPFPSHSFLSAHKPDRELDKNGNLCRAAFALGAGAEHKLIIERLKEDSGGEYKEFPANRKVAICSICGRSINVFRLKTEED